MILLIDNYDSFTYNLVQALGTLDASIDLRVVRNDAVEVEEIETLAPSHIILSPGPCTPNEAGVCNEVVRTFKGRIPILGVCLGHQCIGAVHGMTITRAGAPMHGKTSMIHHDGQGVFADMPNPFEATRYHSLIVDRATVPTDEFEISAWIQEDDIVMGLRWKGDDSDDLRASLNGVQFHPESFLTPEGPRLLANFLNM